MTNADLPDELRPADEARELGAGPHDLRARARILAAPVTVVLMGLCVASFLATLGACVTRIEAPSAMLTGSWIRLEGCGDTLAGLGALRLSDLWLDGAWWRVITAGLLHGSWLHLVLNTWSLWVVGEWVESTWGHARAAVVFAISSVAGCLASAAWVEAPMVVGASAGIMGMAGALFIGRVLGRGTVGARLSPLSARVLGIWLAVLVGLGFFVEMIAQAGHLGGLVAGGLLGLAWSVRGPVVALGARMGLGILFAGLVLAARQPQGRARYDEYLGYAYLERGRDEEAIVAFERALEQRPSDAALANAVAYGWAKEGRELDRAERLVRGALEIEPENADYVDTLGWILCRRGETEAGLVEIRRASALSEGKVAEIEEHLETCATAAER
ncbi:rhomboid family intramembrane serine protease [Paraliomyxa miuraensis]|uniref:rhomboid family intramembrane serine protease n=1 Tax=Paraliomyxa miuraensis TaxID=376150 RepID=UPI00224E6222|nr:rhomboid family intramembrane serine protease [Paraliomyxa miuraensis]MCX4244060.1 rhomboid family intramembrane serine protease [Paraliomyxa miuraensis]